MPATIVPSYIDPASDEIASNAGGFSQTIGTIPFCRPNVRPGYELVDLDALINGPNSDDGGSCLFYLCCCTMKLVDVGQYGFSMRSGVPHFYGNGRYFINNPFEEWINIYNAGDNLITVGPISIVRIPQGSLGFANNNSQPEVLLPGVHVRNDAAFKYVTSTDINNDTYQFGPLKLVTVRSGQVRVCYDQGKVCILHEGRYIINKGPFTVANKINTQQQNMRFSKHPVLLDGGIGLLVEGLLTFKVVDVELLIKELGERDLNHAVQDVTKAEISRVFAGIHLEQISSAIVDNPASNATVQKSLLGTPIVSPANTAAQASSLSVSESTSGTVVAMGSTALATSGEFYERSRICEQIMAYVRPMVEAWGIRLINFQLESTQIADAQYASEYEQASLGMAKAKANLRSVDAENEILIKQAQAKARSTVVEADGAKSARILQAQGEAESLQLEAKSRNEAAKTMSNSFARDYALRGLTVQFAAKLKAKQLTVLPDNIVGAPVANNDMFRAQK